MNTTIIEQKELKPAVLYVMAEGKIQSYSLKSKMTLGRDNDAFTSDISIPSTLKNVSRHHGIFTTEKGKTFYEDVKSANGTWYNNRKLEPNTLQHLSNGDVLRIVSKSHPEQFVTMVYVEDYPDSFSWKRISLKNQNQLEIGRSVSSDIHLNSESISRAHAVLFKRGHRWAIGDRESTNGIYHNNIRLYAPIFLKPGDVIRVQNLNFLFAGNSLIYQQPKHLENSYQFIQNIPKFQMVHKDRLSIHIDERSVISHMKKIVLLQDINMDVNAGEMVLILGGSGAGKTTFMNAVMGYEKADGRILYGNTDVYSEYDTMKYKMGFVPQKDLLRMDDRVIDTLHDAANMKLKKMSHADKEKRINDVLHTLGLEREKNSLIKKLSGGQCKRLSIAVEYISNPSLFFLDEPDSGLDGIMARTLMENLRVIANEGKIVMVISHGPDRAKDLFDKVIVLAKSVKDNCGRLAFYGSVDEAYRFFDTDSLEGVVKRINRPDEGGDGLSDFYIEKYQQKR